MLSKPFLREQDTHGRNPLHDSLVPFSFRFPSSVSRTKGPGWTKPSSPVIETLLLLLLLLIKIFMYKNVVYFYIYNIHVLPYFLRGLKRIANTYVFTENLVSGFSRDNSRVR